MNPYRIYVCPVPDPVLVTPSQNCKNSSQHTPCPEGYLERFEWAQKMKRSYRQKKCPYCKLWVIWVLK